MTFARKPYKRERVFPTPVPLHLRRNASMTPLGSTTFCPKEGNKPGKGTPTKEEARWMSDIVEHGCICCILDGNPPRPAAVHHILSGGRRKGHLYTLPLCDPGHHQNGQSLGMVSRHPDKARFEAQYGTELELLEVVQARINHTGD